MSVFTSLLHTARLKGAAYLLLVDPDKLSGAKLREFAAYAQEAGVDGFLIGGSLMMNGNLEECISDIKASCSVPAVIFPGSLLQISGKADAILYLSLISGRNPEHLIGKHVIAAPLLKQHNLEPIATGYMLIESGAKTTAEYVSGSQPIPRNKPEIAAATALAAEYLGMKCVYLEAGSGAVHHVPFEMVKTVTSFCSIPVIAGGGIRDTATAAGLAECGASMIVTGNHFEDEVNWKLLPEFAAAIHYKSGRLV